MAPFADQRIHREVRRDDRLLRPPRRELVDRRHALPELFA
jgi:hypothetical protein